MAKTRQQQQIEKILGQGSEAAKDHSLQAQAYERATDGSLPKTMTPWEWQEWYASNGIPDSHHQAGNITEQKSGLIRRLRRFFSRSKDSSGQ